MSVIYLWLSSKWLFEPFLHSGYLFIMPRKLALISTVLSINTSILTYTGLVKQLKMLASPLTTMDFSALPVKAILFPWRWPHQIRIETRGTSLSWYYHYLPYLLFKLPQVSVHHFSLYKMSVLSLVVKYKPTSIASVCPVLYIATATGLTCVLLTLHDGFNKWGLNIKFKRYLFLSYLSLK